MWTKVSTPFLNKNCSRPEGQNYQSKYKVFSNFSPKCQRVWRRSFFSQLVHLFLFFPVEVCLKTIFQCPFEHCNMLCIVMQVKSRSCIKVCDRRQTPEACFCVLSTVTCKTSVMTVVVLLFHIWVCRWLSVIGGSKGRIDWLTTWRWLIWWHRHGRPVIHPRLTSTGRLYVTCPALFHVGVDYLFIWLSFSHVFVS